MTDPETPACPRCSPQIEPTADGGWSCLDCGYEWKADHARHMEALMIDALRQQVATLTDDLERERMRLAACTSAALGNTVETVKQRIHQGHPYWSASYGDICAAVDREIALRAQVATLTQALRDVQWTLEGMGFREGSEIRDRIVAALAARGEGPVMGKSYPTVNNAVFCAHCEHTMVSCPSCGKQEWRCVHVSAVPARGEG